AINVPLVQMVAAGAVAVIIFLATRQASADVASVGGFVSYIIAMLMLTAPLKRLTSVNEHLQRGLAAAESVFGMMDEKSEEDRGTHDLGRARGELRFERVRFRYPGRSVDTLQDID